MDEGLTLARLVFLLASRKLSLPDVVAKYLPGGSWLKLLAHGPGLSGIPLDRFEKLYERGERLGPGTPEEAIAIIAALLDRSTMELPSMEKMNVFSALDRMSVAPVMLGAEVHVDLHEYQHDRQEVEFVKWDSGFGPLDDVYLGLYQGLFIVMGKPGTGKTSLLLSVMGHLVDQGIPVLFVENEIPATMLKARLEPIFQRTTFNPGDRLVCASWGTPEILQWITDNPDPNRVVFFDSPDVITGGGGERRFTIEKAYQDLIRIKLASRAVFVTSQPRRSDKVLQLESTAEAWSKAWYCDGLIGVNHAGESTNGNARLRISNLKNRFGPSNRTMIFEYDYENLAWSYPVEGAASEVDEWGEMDW